MLEDLRALVEFAHAGSIAGADDRLFRTPSAITRQVQRLEAALGAELLDRSVKPPRLNSLGARVLEQARDLLQRTEPLNSIAGCSPVSSTWQSYFYLKVKPRLRPFSRTSSRLTVWRSFKAPQATWTVTGNLLPRATPNLTDSCASGSRIPWPRGRLSTPFWR